MNLVKLCVGAQTIDDLRDWQKDPRAKGADGLARHITRMWPKRSAEILAGGSLYWVFKGMILCRQPILDLQEVTGGDGVARCAIVLDPAIIPVAPTPKRPFQGWRYLPMKDSPRDLPASRQDEDPLPRALAHALSEIGLV